MEGGQTSGPGIVGGQIAVPCPFQSFASTLAFFTEKLRMKVELISPADDPSLAVIVGYGVRLRLAPSSDPVPHFPVLILTCDDIDSVTTTLGKNLTAPNGMRITLVSNERPIELPSLKEEFVISKFSTGDLGSSFKTGRAGMQYRDLIPSRLGGRFIASHIRIPNGGPVPDYVHFHKVRFQFIFCVKGWVKVVYEDQGEPFVMQAGDCVLQPPQIRHRVLECSDGLEVVEIGCPAIHDTCGDLVMTLPNGKIDHDREFSGQRFVRHIASESKSEPSNVFPGFAARDTGIGKATSGLAGVRVLRAAPSSSSSCESLWKHQGEFVFFFVLSGSARLHAQGTELLEAGDSVVIPADMPVKWSDVSESLEMLSVTLPEALPLVMNL